jgi:hypothetical protein
MFVLVRKSKVFKEEVNENSALPIRVSSPMIRTIIIW